MNSSAFRYWLGVGVGLSHILIGDRHNKLKSILDSGRPIVVYSHKPSSRVLKGIVDWLMAEGFTFIGAHDFELIAKGEQDGAKKVWLTFDDGRIENLHDVVPVLENLKVPASWFISPVCVEQGVVWSDLTPPDYSREDKIRLLYLNDDERRRISDKWVDEYRGTRKLMTKEDVISLSNNPLFDVCNHTLSHSVCSQMPPELVLEDVQAADEILGKWTGTTFKFVSYPYGYYSYECDNMLRSAGYMPVYTSPGVFENSHVNRNCMYDFMSFAENSCRIVGAWGRIKEFKPARWNAKS